MLYNSIFYYNKNIFRRLKQKEFLSFILDFNKIKSIVKGDLKPKKENHKIVIYWKSFNIRDSSTV